MIPPGNPEGCNSVILLDHGNGGGLTHSKLVPFVCNFTEKSLSTQLFQTSHQAIRCCRSVSVPSDPGKGHPACSALQRLSVLCVQVPWQLEGYELGCWGLLFFGCQECQSGIFFGMMKLCMPYAATPFNSNNVPHWRCLRQNFPCDFCCFC